MGCPPNGCSAKCCSLCVCHAWSHNPCEFCGHDRDAVESLGDFIVGRLEVSFELSGRPLTQGSKTTRIVGKRVKWRGINAVLNPQAISMEIANMATKVLGDGSQRRKSGALDRYRARVTDRARVRMGDRAIALGPIELSAEFVLPRPDSHYTGTGRLTKAAKGKIPPLDLSKLVRAIEDAMTKCVYRDDVQITCYRDVSKRWAERGGVGGVRVAVREL